MKRATMISPQDVWEPSRRKDVVYAHGSGSLVYPAIGREAFDQPKGFAGRGLEGGILGSGRHEECARQPVNLPAPR